MQKSNIKHPYFNATVSSSLHCLEMCLCIHVSTNLVLIIIIRFQMYDCGGCPKYTCLLAASDPLMLSPAVIFSGGQLLACHVCNEIYPQEGLEQFHSAYYVRVPSFSSCSSCSAAYAKFTIYF